MAGAILPTNITSESSNQGKGKISGGNAEWLKPPSSRKSRKKEKREKRGRGDRVVPRLYSLIPTTTSWTDEDEKRKKEGGRKRGGEERVELILIFPFRDWREKKGKRKKGRAKEEVPPDSGSHNNV